MQIANIATWTIAAIATAGVISRPFRWPEAVWAVSGAVLLVALGLLPVQAALGAVAKGDDVYLFLTGMMLLSETARREGLFDWAATFAVNAARGSPPRLFLLVYGVGTLVTIFLSNDATAVVLTPAVFAAASKAKVEPLPFLFVCAFIANAASFVLPISNPANLVLYGNQIPALAAWLARFALPSLLSIVVTFFALRWMERGGLRGRCACDLPQPKLSRGGWTALSGIGLTAIALLTASAFALPLGAPIAILGILTALAVLLLARQAPWPLVRGISWQVLPLVAGLFVLVEAVNRTGATASLAKNLHAASAVSQSGAAAGAGVSVALAGNLVNNLPAGLIARSLVDAAHAGQRITDSLLIGVDLGPNLSVTGSLATILWLAAIRREGEHVSFWRFLKTGAMVMPPALVLALGARLLF